MSTESTDPSLSSSSCSLRDFCGICGGQLHHQEAHDCLVLKYLTRSKAGRELKSRMEGMGAATVAESVSEWICQPDCSLSAAIMILNSALMKVKTFAKGKTQNLWYEECDCANCGRSRVLKTEDGRLVCEKCNWDQMAGDYFQANTK